MTISTVNPATGETIKSYQEMSAEEAVEIVEASHRAFKTWREWSQDVRSDCMRTLAEILIKRKHEYAELIATEMGKPLLQGVAEIEKCAALCLHYADFSKEYLAPRAIKTAMQKSVVTHEPLGIVFGIMPWNFPFWQVFRFAVPALMAGNGALLKHAPISTGSALVIESLFVEAGCLANIFRTVIISNDTAALLMAHPHIAAVTFTGSVAAGKIIAAEAGRNLKKTVLELGGCDAYVVLADADLEKAAEACVTSRMNNAGQSCVAAKRLIVEAKIRDEFIALVEAKLKRYKLGAPLEAETTCGPLARLDIRDQVHQQVLTCVEKGANLVMGGYVRDEPGFYYSPTLLTNVTKGMPAFDEEIFGPVLAVITARNEAEAIALANDTSYGLGAAVFTQDLEHGEKIAMKMLQAGTCVVNTFVASDPALPFGGIKNSGYGRELSAEGILAFVNVKTVNIQQ